MEIDTWNHFFTTVGIPTGLLVIILWFIRAWITQFIADAKEREVRMATRIDALEDFQKTTLLTLIGETKQALSQSSSLIADLHQTVVASNDAVKELVTRMLDRPCLLPPSIDNPSK